MESGKSTNNQVADHPGSLLIGLICANLYRDEGMLDYFCCKVSLGDKFQWTNYVQCSDNFSTWNDQIVFMRNDEDELAVEIWEYSSNSKSTSLIGTVSVPFNLIANDNCKDWMYVYLFEVHAGYIYIKCTWIANLAYSLKGGSQDLYSQVETPKSEYQGLSNSGYQGDLQANAVILKDKTSGMEGKLSPAVQDYFPGMVSHTVYSNQDFSNLSDYSGTFNSGSQGINAGSSFIQPSYQGSYSVNLPDNYYNNFFPQQSMENSMNLKNNYSDSTYLQQSTGYSNLYNLPGYNPYQGGFTGTASSGYAESAPSNSSYPYNNYKEPKSWAGIGGNMGPGMVKDAFNYGYQTGFESKVIGQGMYKDLNSANIGSSNKNSPFQSKIKQNKWKPVNLMTIEEDSPYNPSDFDNYYSNSAAIHKNKLSTKPALDDADLTSLQVKKNTPGFGSVEKRKKNLEKDFKSSSKNPGGYYSFKCGILKKSNFSDSYKDHDSEYLLEFYEWPISDKYFPLFSLKNLPPKVTTTLTSFKETIKKNGQRLPKKFLNFNENDKSFSHLSVNTQKIYAYAIRYYTSDNYKSNNRTQAHEIYTQFTHGNSLNKDFNLINSYIFEAISLLPLFWGFCTRTANLTDSELADYVQGNIICWLHFSSSSKGSKELFPDCNTVFKINSLSGRKIDRFSLYPEEDEVIFLPFSHFLVYSKTVKNSKKYIYLKQIELGIGLKNVLWVDEKNFNENSENKQIIESSFAYSSRTRFILKVSDKSALAYLKSFWGEIMKRDSDNFRIVTSMGRSKNENNTSNGVEFICHVINLGFNCEIMIFAGNTGYPIQKLYEYNIADRGIRVTNSNQEVFNFIQFQ